MGAVGGGVDGWLLLFFGLDVGVGVGGGDGAGGGVRVVFVVEGVVGKKDVRVAEVTEGEMPGLIKGLEEPVEGGPRYMWFTRGAGVGISE